MFSRDEATRIIDLYRDIIHPFPCVIQITLPVTTKAWIHGKMLDEAFKTVNLSNLDSEFILTMDSDCFPVADGWLEDLEKMLDKGARLAGILHPWAPPSKKMNVQSLEFRIRSQHCYETTHVACQMLRTKDLEDLNVPFAGGDDTGLLIPLEAKKRGWKIDGFKLTRCAFPRDDSDPEFNRYSCLIFGDKIYHHGGFTRIFVSDDKPELGKSYDWVMPEIISQRSADFLLEKSYKFLFDREEDVAKDKMDRLTGIKTMLKNGI